MYYILLYTYLHLNIHLSVYFYIICSLVHNLIGIGLTNFNVSNLKEKVIVAKHFLYLAYIIDFINIQMYLPTLEFN